MEINAKNYKDFLSHIESGNYVVIFYSKWFKHSNSIINCLSSLALKYLLLKFRAVEMDESEEVAIACDVSGMINVFFISTV
jgi:hypothetical protein